MPFFLLIMLALPLLAAHQAPPSVIKTIKDQEAQLSEYRCPDNANWAAWDELGNYRADRSYCQCDEGFTGDIIDDILVCTKTDQQPPVNTNN